MGAQLDETSESVMPKAEEISAQQPGNDSADEDDSDNEPAKSTQATKKKNKRGKKKKATQAVEQVPKTIEEPVTHPIVQTLRPDFGVALHGLTGAVELNGVTGHCTEWNEEKGRWHVQLRTGDVKAFKPDNLRILAASEDCVSSISTDEVFQEWVKQALASGVADTMAEAERIKMDDDFDGYKFSGSLRPAFVAPQMDPPEGASLPDYALDPEGIAHSESRLRNKPVPVLEGEELLIMREVCRLGREVLDIASRYLRAGVTGDEIDRVVYRACSDRYLYPSPLNYSGFPKSVCVSPNEVICHGIPNCRPIQEGDIVNLDISVYYKGYHSDLNEIFFIGKCDEDSHTLVRAAYDALKASADMIKPGTMYRDLGAAIHATSANAGCSVVPSFCGHGVGKLFHGPPDVPHYKKNKAVGIMKAGHVFTIEPMLNFGSNNGDKMWPDDWTAVTRDGKRSAQFEHSFLVTQDGFEVLTARRGAGVFSMPPYDPCMFQR